MALAGRSKGLIPVWLVVGAFIASLVWLVGWASLTPVVPAIYGVVSGVLFFLYGLDKRAARLDRRRVPERRLQALALLGGWPGALLAQQLFRHKTRKLRFQVVFWLIVLLHLVVLGALLLAHGIEGWRNELWPELSRLLGNG
ncbi:DUF1294 domain-containing protein [Marinobacter sp. JSM 1782161]|uniref:DUF1294 domain-containing protein n=1 Tax=Marinobacter sp. JSM 1782161 TaxID=2685906 RepID=UPI0014029DB6|nr:DUF1294 domain-containing protein [Marinobacter sp. JSM 1782161]